MRHDQLESHINMGETTTMTNLPSDVFDVRSEAKGAHWIAWVVLSGHDTPDGSVVLVGQTQEEAETRARQWAENRVASTDA